MWTYLDFRRKLHHWCDWYTKIRYITVIERNEIVIIYSYGEKLNCGQLQNHLRYGRGVNVSQNYFAVNHIHSIPDIFQCIRSDSIRIWSECLDWLFLFRQIVFEAITPLGRCFCFQGCWDADIYARCTSIYVHWCHYMYYTVVCISVDWKLTCTVDWKQEKKSSKSSSNRSPTIVPK